MIYREPEEDRQTYQSCRAAGRELSRRQRILLRF